MKKTLFLMMLFISVIIASCSDDKDPMPGVVSNVTFNLISPNVDQTRTVNITRYIAEVYKTSDLTTVVQRVEQASGTIVVSLETNINYTCLFWADGVAPQDNTNGTYNALDLKNVTLNTGQNMAEAFFGQLDITNSVSTFSVALKRATARVNIIETDAVIASKDLQIKYDEFVSFNTFSGEAIGAINPATKVFNSTVTTGTLGTFLTFASVGGILTTFTVTYDALTSNTIPSVPLKANYITNIRGKYAVGDQTYTFILDVDDNFDSPIQGIDVNLGTAVAPSWYRIADRNALKGGVYGATVSPTDFGYYYAWSNATNDPTNEDKAYRACFDFGEGSGAWRLPTRDEWAIISGNNGASTTNNNERKLKIENNQWRIYNERPGQTNHIVLPTTGYSLTAGTVPTDPDTTYGNYWTSTIVVDDNTKAYRHYMYNDDFGTSIDPKLVTLAFTVRCVRSLTN